MGVPRKLVIVESPAKAKTIEGYLGAGYTVQASIGHIRDLPQPSDLPAEMKKGPYRKFAVNVEDHFEPYYVIDPGKKAKVAELRKALKDADELYLATDEDREGEAIAWHLLEVLKPKVPVKRMVFHEITRPAIAAALAGPRNLNVDLVDAQETRRILDRLYGYEMSPVLWRKVGKGLSAGRVQSVATRMVVERERERIAFVAAGYWDLVGTFATDAGETFQARLVSLGSNRVATGRDFDDAGRLTSAGTVAIDEATATGLAKSLDGAAFVVGDLSTKPYRRRPAAPFTTSTLQQEASRKLRMNSRRTMQVAQRLYENGFITYMRTDSVHLSDQALAAARQQAVELYGPASVPAAPRLYATTAKGAQEAHEAIRPAGETFRTPSDAARELSGEDARLYELIWKRTIASQMNDAKGQTATVRIDANAGDSGPVAFQASGTVITDRGFLAAYEEGRDDARYDKGREGEARLPKMSTGEQLDATAIEAEGHETTPPPRYTEASLVAALEKRGIGRPSTYASIMSVIEDRGYVERRGQALVPSWVAFSVTGLLEDYFADLVDYDFTAEMEASLDRIAEGAEAREAWLRSFYYGVGDSNETDLEKAERDPGHNLAVLGLKRMVEDQDEIDARAINTVELGDGIELRVGRYGPYLEEPATQPGATPRRAPVPAGLAPDELTEQRARELLSEAAKATPMRTLGVDPKTGNTVVVRDGRFGPYVTEVIDDGEAAGNGKGGKKAAVKPRNVSLFSSMSIETVTLDQAVALLGLPRTVGTDPATGEVITAQNGRFGPYLKRGTVSRSLPNEEAIFSVTLDEAVALFAAPKAGRGSSSPLKELGQDPATGKPLVVKSGRYGPYVTDGETNATLPRGEEPEAVTLERAVELLAAKRAKGPSTRGARGGTRARKKEPPRGGRARPVVRHGSIWGRGQRHVLCALHSVQHRQRHPLGSCHRLHAASD
ncbi:MAG: type I DNA topoisomerase [Bifidobacteriaceae bacterium]|nr:type I DNA topoisomerase [Bifidobacteriaceae bacterium]